MALLLAIASCGAEPVAPLRADGGTSRDGGSPQDGGGAAQDGSGATLDGGASFDGGGTAQDGGGTAQDGGGTALYGGGAAQDGGGTALDGGGATQDGSVALDGGAVPDGGPAPDGGTTVHPAFSDEGWRVVFADEFEGRPCDPAVPGSCAPADEARVAACYGVGRTAAPVNLQHRFHAWTPFTTQVVRNDLMDLDKCVWSVSDHVNWIHFTGANHEHLISHNRPDMVRVANGELLLGTRYAGGAGPCGTNTDPEDPTGQDCPYASSVVTTIPFHGEAAAFPKTSGPYAAGDGLVMSGAGKIEVRAKMPFENGNMAAIWTWAADPSRFEHEHDILEYFVNWRDAHHHGEVMYSANETTGKGSWVISPPGSRVRFDEFHVYGLEWSASQYLRFLFDGREVVRVQHGERLPSASNVCRAMEVRGNPFYLILWNLMTNYWYAPSAAPSGPGHPPDWHHVDWVRVSEPCTPGERGCARLSSPSCPDPCGGYGRYEEGACIVGEPPAARRALVVDGQYAYGGDGACAAGGMPSGESCLLGGPPAGRTATIVGGKFAVEPLCQPVEDRYNCARPCPWPGTTLDAHGCYVGAAPPGRVGFVWSNGFYYEPASSDPATACPDGGTFDSAHCYLGSAPVGAIAEYHDGKYYLQPDHCRYGGIWDGARRACLFVTPPAGRTSFLYAGNAYYTPAAGTPRCESGASFDGANCFVTALPEGADAFVAENRVWLRETCGPVTSARSFFESANVQPDRENCP